MGGTRNKANPNPPSAKPHNSTSRQVKTKWAVRMAKEHAQAAQARAAETLHNARSTASSPSKTSRSATSAVSPGKRQGGSEQQVTSSLFAWSRLMPCQPLGGKVRSDTDEEDAEDQADGEDGEDQPEPTPEPPTRQGNAGYTKGKKTTSQGNEKATRPVANYFTGGVSEDPKTGKDVSGRAKRTGPMKSMNEKDMQRQVMNPYEHAYLAKYNSIFGQQ